MIISHKHKCLFVELQHTGSTAISKELRENYDGVPILNRHSYYHEFQKIATDEEKGFFVFSCIRNPLDVVVSNYFRYKTDQLGIFSNPRNWKENGGHLNKLTRMRFNFINDTNADFSAYFKKFYKYPYDNWSSLAHHKFDFIIRFENLAGDFTKALKLIGIKAKRPLPIVNKTGERNKDFWSYYTPEIRDQAQWVFGPFMKKWGYEFPPEWGSCHVPWSTQIVYSVLGFFRRHLEWRAADDFGTVKPTAEQVAERIQRANTKVRL